MANGSPEPRSSLDDPVGAGPHWHAMAPGRPVEPPPAEQQRRAGGILAWLGGFPEWFLPPDFPRDRRSQVRARILIVVGPLMGIGTIAWVLGVGIGLGIAEPPYLAPMFLLLVGLATGALPFLLRRGVSLTPLSVALVATILGQNAVVWLFSGGQLHDALQMVPVGLGLACFTLGLRGGLWTSAIIAVSIAGMIWLKSAGLVPPSVLPPAFQDVMHYYRAALATLGALLVVASVMKVNDRMEMAYSKARDAAEAGIRARSAFLATVSHELRTPVAGMLGSIALLEGSPLTPQQRDWLAALRLSTEGLSGTLNDLLDLSRQEAGERRDRPQPTAPAALVEEILCLFTAQAATKGIWLKSDLDPALPSRLSLDSAALRQVMINLIGNAVRATDKGGVTLVVRCLTGRYGLNLMITVRDTGHGFDPAQNPLGFDTGREAEAPDPAARVPDRPGAARHATGGLAICARLIAGMGGRLEAFGMAGAGASFRITVPVERLPSPEGMAAMPAAERAASRPYEPGIVAPGDAATAGSAGHDILVAEDSDTNRMLLGALLERVGHRPHLVADGTAALAAVRAAERRSAAGGAEPDAPAVPDLLLLDIQMPGLTGTEVARAVRIVPGPLQHVPILGLTADATPEHRQGYLDAGMDDLLYKPVRLPELQDAIERLVRQGAARQRSVGGNAAS